MLGTKNKIKKYEYKTVSVDFYYNDPEPDLKKLGEEGWALCSKKIRDQPFSDEYIFIREL